MFLYKPNTNLDSGPVQELLHSVPFPSTQCLPDTISHLILGRHYIPSYNVHHQSFSQYVDYLLHLHMLPSSFHKLLFNFVRLGFLLPLLYFFYICIVLHTATSPSLFFITLIMGHIQSIHIRSILHI